MKNKVKPIQKEFMEELVYVCPNCSNRVYRCDDSCNKCNKKLDWRQC